MKPPLPGLLLLALTLALGQSSPSTPPSAAPAPPHRTMLVGVAHDGSILTGGIEGPSSLKPGKADVVPIGWVSEDGQWTPIPCGITETRDCKRFNADYLRKTHTYSVITAEGFGTNVQTSSMELDNECFGIGGQGTFPSGAFRFAGVAAEDPSFFTSGPPAIRLAKDAAAPLRRSLKSSVGQKLDSTEWLAVYSLTLEGHPLIVFQRPFQSWAPLIKNPATSTASFSEIFAIASQEAGKFALLHWKDNTGDDNQQILGVIHLQSGREFLVTTSSDPESQRYRIYGYRNGKFAMVFRYTAAEC